MLVSKPMPPHYQRRRLRNQHNNPTHANNPWRPLTHQHSPQYYQIINPYPIMVIYPATYMYDWPYRGVLFPCLVSMPPPPYWYANNPHPLMQEYQVSPNWASTTSTPSSRGGPRMLGPALPDDLYPTPEELRSYWTINTEDQQGMEES